jgi:hypothetical protein
MEPQPHATAAKRPNGANKRPKSQHSAVSNGTRLFAAVDTRLDPRKNAWVRRLRDLFDIYIAHRGGWDAVSAPERAIIRRIASFDVELELLEKRFALKRTGADAADLDLYFRGASHQRRLLESIGLKRSLKDVTPDLSDYWNQSDPVEPEEATP